MQEFLNDTRYESQQGPGTCGAACLTMAYAACGQTILQDAIWPRVARRNRFGRNASTTCLMTADALDRGFDAVAFQTRDPLATLRACSDAGVQAILSTHLDHSGTSGHYVLLLDIDSEHVILHDPFTGPRRILRHAELLALWQTDREGAEATGHMLIGIGRSNSDEDTCAECRRPSPKSVACPRCATAVGLRPWSVLGCMDATCVGRLWERLCCPRCDLLWQAGPDVAPEAPTVAPAVDLGRVFAALDAFVTAAVDTPGASGHPDVARLMNLLAGSRTQLADAVAADTAGRAMLATRQRAATAALAARIRDIRGRSLPTPPPRKSRQNRSLMRRSSGARFFSAWGAS